MCLIHLTTCLIERTILGGFLEKRTGPIPCIIIIHNIISTSGCFNNKVDSGKKNPTQTNEKKFLKVSIISVSLLISLCSFIRHLFLPVKAL